MPGNTNCTPRRMRSTIVSIGLVGALAVSLGGCGSKARSAQGADPRCIDADTFDLVDESNCAGIANQQNCLPVTPTVAAVAGATDQPNCLVAGPTPTGTRSGTTRTRRYTRYYGGTVNSGRVTGGSFTQPAAVSTGGFGKSATGKSSTKGGKSGGSSSSGGKSGGS